MRQLVELPHHLRASKRYEQAAETYSNLGLMQAMCDAGLITDLLRYIVSFYLIVSWVFGFVAHTGPRSHTLHLFASGRFKTASLKMCSAPLKRMIGRRI